MRCCLAYRASWLLNLHRVPRVGFGTESFGTTMLWRVTLQRQQGKSPLAIESIDDCYCRLHAASCRSEECHEPRRTSKPMSLFCREVYAAFSRGIGNQCRRSLHNWRREVRAVSPERSSYMVHENGKQRASHCGSFMIRMNNSNAFSRSCASWTNWSFARQRTRRSLRR